jgi:hypothetical protein
VSDLRRREFITLLGGATVAWPLAAHAQQGERMRRIGVLNYLTADDPNSSPRVAAFAQALQGLGWIDGRNIQIDYRWGGGDLDRSRRYATELVALGPDVILVSSGSALAALQNVTHTVPIVFCQCQRPGRRWLRRKPCASGRQYNRIYPVRVRHERQMARASQTDRARDDASGSHSRSLDNFRNCPVCCNPGCGTVTRGGVDAD